MFANSLYPYSKQLVSEMIANLFRTRNSLSERWHQFVEVS